MLLSLFISLSALFHFAAPSNTPKNPQDGGGLYQDLLAELRFLQATFCEICFKSCPTLQHPDLRRTYERQSLNHVMIFDLVQDRLVLKPFCTFTIF